MTLFFGNIRRAFSDYETTRPVRAVIVIVAYTVGSRTIGSPFMRRFLTMASALILAAGAAGRASAQVAYTSSIAFEAAIAGDQQSVENYSALSAGTLINAGDTLDGITYTAFTPGPSGELLGGIITNEFNSSNSSGTSLGGNQSDGAEYFFGGDNVTVSFAAPVIAFGIFFNVNPNSGAFGFTSAAGDSFTGSAAYDTVTFVFAGLVSNTPFSSVTFGSTDPAGSYNIPAIITAVPEPSSLALVGIGLTTLGGRLWHRRRLAA
jgi:hypothetical protein